MSSAKDTIVSNFLYTMDGLSLLQNCIGKSINGIAADHIDITYGRTYSYDLMGLVYIGIDQQQEALRLSYSYVESSLGIPFHTLSIDKSVVPTITCPGVRIRFPDPLIVGHIEIYGVDEHMDTTTPPSEADYALADYIKEEFAKLGEDIETPTVGASPWPIQRQNPGKRIVQQVYDESILVFHFTEGKKMTVYPQDPFVYAVIEERDKMNRRLQNENIRRKLEITKKGVIPYDRPSNE